MVPWGKNLPGKSETGVRILNTQGNARARGVWQSACNCNQKSDIRDPWSKLASQTPRTCEFLGSVERPSPNE